MFVLIAILLMKMFDELFMRPLRFVFDTFQEMGKPITCKFRQIRCIRITKGACFVREFVDELGSDRDLHALNRIENQ